MSVLHYTPKPWEPMYRVHPDPAEVARARKIAEAEGYAWVAEHEIWVNDDYQAFVRYLEEDGTREGLCSCSIKRNDATPVQDWREKQAIKNDVFGAEREAIEIYPAESRLVDEADQAWLWVLPAGVTVGIGFNERLVQTDDVRRERLLDKGGSVAASKGSQRNWRPGISTGPDYHPGGET